jgi:fatty-acyl-CoA synthase
VTPTCGSDELLVVDPLVHLIDHAPLAIWRDMAARTIVARASFVWPERPDRLPAAMLAMQRWGMSLPGGVAASAARYPHGVAIIDDNGSLSYAELFRSSHALAAALAAANIRHGQKVGLLARNHAGFVIAAVAVAQTGANLVLLNTGFAGAQLADAAGSEGLDAIIHDDEFTDLVADSDVKLTLDERAVRTLVLDFAGAKVAPPAQPGALVVLTSGTTGRPKGAARHARGATAGIASILARIPLRARNTVIDAAPLFHAWGLTHMMLALSLSSTLVLHRRFDAAETLEDIERHQADVLVVVPVMLQRILALGPDALVRTDTSSLRIIAASGSALGGKLATDTLNRFGPILYNVYGSTEVATATIATPKDLQAAPTTAGRQAPAARVEILDDDGNPLPAGSSGRIFVGSPMRFDGYTAGGSKEAQRGLLSSGDMGHFDAAGRLFIDGRDDDMIVSGGENVFPGEVEELLTHHPAIAEVVVIGIDDEEFGQALKAVIVRRVGIALNVEGVRRHVGENLARYKVPRQVVFVDELPRSATGKVLKRRLT